MINELRVTLDPTKLAVAMANKGFNVTMLAEAAGRSRVIVTQWINARTLSPRQAGELAKALDCNIKDLI